MGKHANTVFPFWPIYCSLINLEFKKIRLDYGLLNPRSLRVYLSSFTITIWMYSAAVSLYSSELCNTGGFPGGDCEDVVSRLHFLERWFMGFGATQEGNCRMVLMIISFYLCIILVAEKVMAPHSSALAWYSKAVGFSVSVPFLSWPLIPFLLGLSLYVGFLQSKCCFHCSLSWFIQGKYMAGKRNSTEPWAGVKTQNVLKTDIADT